MSTEVLLVTGSYPPERCGVGDYSRQLAVALAAVPGTAVSVLTTGLTPAPVTEDGVKVIRAMPDWSLRRTGRLFRHLRRIRPDIVHVQYPTQGYRDGGLPWLIPLLARGLGVRVVQTWHEGYPRDLAKFSLLAMAPGPVIVVRDAFARQFGRAFGRVAGRRRLTYIRGASTLPYACLSRSQAVAIRERHGASNRRFLVFFGFIHPEKQIEQLFAIADPATDHILIIGDAGDRADYLAKITALAESDRWAGRARMIGFAEPDEAAAILAVADAVVLPLKAGGGEWNSAILAGILQGTFVLTTSTVAHGYRPDLNVYYARVDDLTDMKGALAAHAGTRRADAVAYDWRSVAKRHLDLYRSLLPAPRRAAA